MNLKGKEGWDEPQKNHVDNQVYSELVVFEDKPLRVNIPEPPALRDINSKVNLKCPPGLVLQDKPLIFGVR